MKHLTRRQWFLIGLMISFTAITSWAVIMAFYDKTTPWIMAVSLLYVSATIGWSFARVIAHSMDLNKQN